MIKENFADDKLPKEVQQFVNSLTPDDVGVDTVGEYIIHYEGFTDQCNDGHDDDSIQDVYADVYQDFDNRQGQEALIRGVANDELHVDCNPVLYSVYKNVKENKFNFKLIDNEITEGRLLRTTNNFKKLTGRDVADLLYLNSLVIYIMAKDSKQSDFALGYARKTTQYGNYTLFRTHATDMYLLSYIVNNPDSKQIKLKDSIFSKRFLNSCKFQPKEHSKFFYKLATQGKVPLATTYFMSLEKQIKINDSRYKSWRRMAVDWEHLKYRSRQYIVAKIIQEFRRIAVTSELVSNLQTMTKYRSYDITDKYSRKPSTGRKVAGAVAGAVAGGYAGKKIAKKLGKDSDKYKKAGAGIGAIAGYWAGGRQRQK